MSTYEKIASVVIGVFLVFVIIFSYHEIKEPTETGASKSGSRFDDSFGQDFKIGVYGNLVSEQVSGGMEGECAALQPVIMGALHDIEERLNAGDTFEVNERTLKLFCNREAQIVLSDVNGNKLILEKVPFARTIPSQGTDADIGTRVRINATSVSTGAPTPDKPTTFGDVFIPDRFLDSSTSTGN